MKTADRTSLILRIYAVLTLIFGVSTVALFLCSLCKCYDSEIGYFSIDAAMPKVFVAFCIVWCIIALSIPFFVKKDELPVKQNFGSTASYLGGAYSAFVMIGSFVFDILRCVQEKTVSSFFEYADLLSKRGNSYIAYSYRIQGAIIIVGLIASLVTAVFFFIRLDGKKNREWYVILGFAPGFRCVSGLASIYFDMTVEMNSPNKLIHQVCLIAIMVYFVYELRMLLGEKKARPRAYVATGLIAIVFSAATSIPGIVCYFMGILDNSKFFTESFFCFNMCIYITTRVITYILQYNSDEGKSQQAE